MFASLYRSSSSRLFEYVVSLVVVLVELNFDSLSDEDVCRPMKRQEIE